MGCAPVAQSNPNEHLKVVTNQITAEGLLFFRICLYL